MKKIISILATSLLCIMTFIENAIAQTGKPSDILNQINYELINRSEERDSCFAPGSPGDLQFRAKKHTYNLCDLSEASHNFDDEENTGIGIKQQHGFWVIVFSLPQTHIVATYKTESEARRLLTLLRNYKKSLCQVKG